ncbi:hypothetical protein VTN02DRAFT_421 [Thermoascus thermophilus]
MAPGFPSVARSTPAKPAPSSRPPPDRAGAKTKKVPFAQQRHRTGNASILSFFPRADGPPRATSTQARITQFATPIRREGKTKGPHGSAEGGLFLEDRSRTADPGEDATRPTTPDEDLWGGADGTGDDGLFAENGGPAKRRKVDRPSSSPAGENRKTTTASHRSGPFIDESDSEDGLDALRDVDVDVPGGGAAPIRTALEEEDPVADETRDQPLVSAASHMDDLFADFDDLDEPPVGEEEEEDEDVDEDADDLGLERCDSNGPGEAEAPACPVCQADLAGLSDTVRGIYLYPYQC